jgi:hypothetical protein
MLLGALWRCSPWGDEVGGFWVVAVRGDTVIWFNDIEGGFNISRFHTPGIIDEYSCNQSDISEAMAATLPRSQDSSVRPERRVVEAEAGVVEQAEMFARDALSSRFDQAVGRCVSVSQPVTRSSSHSRQSRSHGSRRFFQAWACSRRQSRHAFSSPAPPPATRKNPWMPTPSQSSASSHPSRRATDKKD